MTTKTTTKSTREKAAEAGATVPADHLARGEAAGDMLHCVYEGFEFEFDRDVLDDDAAMTSMEQGNPYPLLGLMGADAETIAAIKKHLTPEDGRLKRSAVLEFTGEALKAAGQGKS